MTGKTLLDKLIENGSPVEALCGGNHRCGKCKVTVRNREIPVDTAEMSFLSEQEMVSGIRLACFHEWAEGDDIQLVTKDMVIASDLSLIQQTQFHYRQEYGAVLDIGTTTVVLKLINCRNGQEEDSVSFVNPQRVYGADVISRISAYQKYKENLDQVLIQRVEEVIKERNWKFQQMIVAGNTTMLNIFLKADPTPLGQYPFDVPILGMKTISSREIFSSVPQQFQIITFPNFSAYVGGDITAGLYAYDFDQVKEPALFIDLGTNGEMALCTPEKITVTATAAGPAFEGVGIKCGGGAVPGAISSVELEPLKVTTVQNERPVCICGSGIVSLSAELVRHQRINRIGKLKSPQVNLSEQITFDQKDMQSFQLAKSAVQAGVSILLKSHPEVNRVLIAGGLGQGIDAKDLKTIGVLPKKIQAVSVGNSSLAGCYKLLMTEDFKRVENIPMKGEVIDLASYPGFEDAMINSLYFDDC